ncbi:MAG: chromosome segregation protein SMC [Deltaproteobacteria bacterium]|nr:chromosome segregation protein SMC [Deltaproteobacteria bacterium]
MKLKKVEIKGFKSLAKKISLTLSDGVTCIAGPNGCGKSNLIDAIRWALGEQSIRSLRAGSMSDVIFSGTQDTPSSSLAQVTLEFIRDQGYFPKSLDGFDEVSISRKLFRTGESVYFINNVKCRLKDITDIFLDTGLDRHGYAIIEQGKIKDIIQSRPEDIRYLIEEVAEVGKFRIKRADAIKRLEATSINLERIRDLLSEVSRQKEDLRGQANKAKRYQVVRYEINDLTRNLWLYELDTISAASKELEQEKQGLDDQIEAFQRQYQEYSSLIGTRTSHLAALRENMDSTGIKWNEANSRVLLAQRDIDTNQKRKKDIDATLEMIETRIEQLKNAINQAHKEYTQGRQEIDSLSSQIDGVQAELAREQESGESIYQEYRQLEDDFNHGRAKLFDSIGNARAVAQRLSSLKTRHQEVISNIQKRNEDLAEIKDKKRSLQHRLLDLDRTIQGSQDAMGKVDDRLRSVIEAMNILQGKIDKETKGLVDREKEHAQLGAKITMLERIINSGTKEASAPAAISNGTRKVADTLKVHTGFEETVGKSIGEALDFVIIHDHEEVESLLNKGDSDPGYILRQPHLKNTGEQALSRGDGVIGPLSECMEVREGFEDIVCALSQDMWVVEDIRCALMLWKQGIRSLRFVTREGIIVEPSGAVRTSSEMMKYAEGLKAKAEKEQLMVHMHLVEETIKDTSVRLEVLRSEYTALNNEKAEVNLRKEEIGKQTAGHLDSRHEILRDLERTGERESSFERDIVSWNEMAGKLNDDINAISSDKDVLDAEIEQSQSLIKSLDEKKEAAKAVYEKARQSLQENTARCNELKVAYASRRERIQGIEINLEKMNQEMEKDDLRVRELMHTHASVIGSLETSSSELKRANEEISSLQKLKEQLQPEIDDLTDGLQSLRESREQCRENMDHLEKTRNSYMLRHKEHEIAYSMSKERLVSRFGKDIQNVPDDFNPEQAREKVDSLEKRIEKMGQINFASIDAYENVQARWDDLHRQYEDIVQAGTRLKEVISNIERQSTKAFMSTFQKVKVNFQEIFTAIFGGGKADIVLIDEEGMEPGVEIFASPPFKRLRSMTLLSEGEKTLCALSFVFALFKVRPSPFCILDEVDAPLDDANVIRFNRLIRTFAKDSQFIIVTHNRYTMEMADIIYGVTFDVPGISKVVSLILQDMEEQFISHQ